MATRNNDEDRPYSAPTRGTAQRIEGADIARGFQNWGRGAQGGTPMSYDQWQRDMGWGSASTGRGAEARRQEYQRYRGSRQWDQQQGYQPEWAEGEPQNPREAMSQQYEQMQEAMEQQREFNEQAQQAFQEQMARNEQARMEMQQELQQIRQVNRQAAQQEAATYQHGFALQREGGPGSMATMQSPLFQGLAQSYRGMRQQAFDWTQMPQTMAQMGQMVSGLDVPMMDLGPWMTPEAQRTQWELPPMSFGRTTPQLQGGQQQAQGAQDPNAPATRDQIAREIARRLASGTDISEFYS